MIDKIIPLWLKERSHQSIWLLISFLIIGCWSLPATHSLIQTIPQLTNPIMAKITITLFLLSLGLMASLGILHRKPNLKDYEIINPPGFMKHRKTGRYYCHPCLFSKQIASPLSVMSEKEFQCRICKESYKIDYLLLINNSYLSIVKDNDPLFKDHDKAVTELVNKKNNR